VPFACIVLPGLPVQAALRERYGSASAGARVPLALFNRAGEQRRGLVGASAAAAEMGVRPGMSVSTAESRCPELELLEDEPDRTAAALSSLADALIEIGPVVANTVTLHSAARGRSAALEVTLPGALLVDLTGVRLPGQTGLAQAVPSHFVRHIARIANAMGFLPRVAVAFSPWAALVLASVPDSVTTASPEPSPIALPLPPDLDRIRPLSVAAARLPTDAERALQVVGIRTVGALLALPVPSVERRFGVLTGAIVRALAARDASRDVARLIPLTPTPIVVERAVFDDAIDDRDALGFALKTVADRVSRRLGSRGDGAEAVELELQIEPAEDHQLLALFPGATVNRKRRSHTIELDLGRPESGAGLLRDLLLERLGAMPPPGPVCGLSLTVIRASRQLPRQLDLFAEPEPRETITTTVARLAAVLDDTRLAVVSVEDYRPERAFRLVPFTPEPGGARRRGNGAAPPPPRGPAAPPGDRPTRLFREPQPWTFELERRPVLRAVAAAPDMTPYSDPPLVRARETLESPPGAVSGPERLVSGWWDDSPMARDYWVVKDRWGRRSWVFRDLATRQWFVHGVFD